MNEATKKAKESWEFHKDNNEPYGQGEFYYQDNGKYYQAGYLKGHAEATNGTQVLVEALEKIESVTQAQASSNAERWLGKCVFVASEALTKWRSHE